MQILWDPRLTPKRALLIGILDMVVILSQCIPAKRIPYDDGFPKENVKSLLYVNEDLQFYQSDDINMDSESKADQSENYDSNGERLLDWSTENFDTSSEVLHKKMAENLPSYKSDDINMDIESKADQLGNYDNDGERLSDWSAESFDTSSEALRKKTLVEFMSLSDNASKKFSFLNSRDSPDESFDESLSSSENNVFRFDEDKENELFTRYNRDHIPSSSENDVLRFDEDNENDLFTRSSTEDHILSSSENKVLRFDEDNENEILTRYNREDQISSSSENDVLRFDEDNENDIFTTSSTEDHIFSSSENKVLRFDEDNEKEILARYNRENHIASPSDNNVLHFDADNENEILTRYNREDHIPPSSENNVLRFDEYNENDLFTRSNREDRTLSSSENKVLRFDEDNENEILTRYNREDHTPSPFENKVLHFDEDKENELLTRYNREDNKEDYVLDLQTTTPVIPKASWAEFIPLKRKEEEFRNQNSQLHAILVDMSQRNKKLQDELEKLKLLYSEPYKSLPSYKSDYTNMDVQSKADEPESLPDFSTKTFDTKSEVFRKKTLEEFTDSIFKKLFFLNSHNSPDKSFDESLSSSKNNVHHFDEDNENELLIRGNRVDHTDDYISETQSTTVIPLMAWMESLLLRRNAEALRNQNNKQQAVLIDMSKRNQKLQQDLEILKSFISKLNEKFPSYKSDDISTNGESKTDQPENYDTNVERLPDWFTESIHTSSKALRKKTLQDFLSHSDTISKRFPFRNSRDSSHESVDESFSSFETYLLSSDEDSENELLTRGNIKDRTEDYVLDSQPTTPVTPAISWTEMLFLKRKEKALRNENSKLHAILEGMSQRNKKLQHEMEKLKSFVSEISTGRKKQPSEDPTVEPTVNHAQSMQNLLEKEHALKSMQGHSHRNDPASEHLQKAIESLENAFQIMQNEHTPQIMENGNAPQIIKNGNVPQIMKNEHTPQIIQNEHAPQIMQGEHSPQIMQDEHSSQIMQNEHSHQIMEKEHDPLIMQNPYVPQIMQNQHAPQIMQNGNTPQIMQNGNTPQIMQNGSTPQTLQNGNAPQIMQNQHLPQIMQNGNMPQILQNGNAPQSLENKLETIQNDIHHKEINLQNYQNTLQGLQNILQSTHNVLQTMQINLKLEKYFPKANPDELSLPQSMQNAMEGIQNTLLNLQNPSRNKQEMSRSVQDAAQSMQIALHNVQRALRNLQGVQPTIQTGPSTTRTTEKIATTTAKSTATATVSSTSTTTATTVAQPPSYETNMPKLQDLYIKIKAGPPMKIKTDYEDKMENLQGKENILDAYLESLKPVICKGSLSVLITQTWDLKSLSHLQTSKLQCLSKGMRDKTEDPLQAERAEFIRKGAIFLRHAWNKFKQKKYGYLS
ncbi:hypothetical protein TNCT_667911 [Trichonephila clavata]|uniref:Uncharacterized protein n=1 Tax=Trichonephila clavata TaxID=2740835 RepID=A0A8X6LCA0_TRICU|nr:hypothetical protein TNCT_667911 [Trichonephila clavata]